MSGTPGTLAFPAPSVPIVAYLNLRILITGSRSWTDHDVIRQALVKAWKDFEYPHPSMVTVVHGNAKGADKWADHYARSLGFRVERHPVTPKMWREQGRGAGTARNQRMVDLGADVCLAFHKDESRGTAHCIRACVAAGIPVSKYVE
jgi:hypothetical protein